MKSSFLLLRFFFFCMVVGGCVLSFANGPLAEGVLEIRGARLTIYADADTNDADQVVNVGERARVRTCYGAAAAACGEVAPGDPRIAGLEVRAELRGPELPQPVELTTVPGGTFLLPGFQQEGDYLLENIRLVDRISGEVLGSADPPLAVIHVRRILLTRAEVRTLSLEDLAARGITLSEENFQAFDFAVGFAIGGSVVDIELPVLYEGGGDVSVLSTPTVQLDGLPPDVAELVRRWQPPSIVPFALELPERSGLDVGEEPYAPITFPVFGAIVMPGSVSFLNQFFDATLIVANGAPPGTGVELDNLEATLRLPGGNVLRLAATEPPVAPGQRVPLRAPDGAHRIGESEQAAATWTVEGLVAGTHVLQMEVEGELHRPGRPTVPVATRAQAAVEVVDARFHLVFSHPDVVREGTAYTLYVTVTNLSRATQYEVSIAIRDEHITGAHKEDPSESFAKEIDRPLDPGQSETLEFRLVADLTGQVVGGTFESSGSGGTGAIELYTGVGEMGIPLSPATLRLPRFSERLAPPFVSGEGYLRAATHFLGLAYSLAVAPAALTPQGLPRVIRSDVEVRAADLGHAGQRTFLSEGLLESLEVLLLEQLGNREPLAEIDALRRASDKGLQMGTSLSELLRGEQQARGLDAVELFDHFAETTSYARPYLAVLLAPAFTQDLPALEIRQITEPSWDVLAGAGDAVAPQRGVEFGEILAIRATAGGDATVPLAVVGSVAEGEHHDVYLRNGSDEQLAGHLVLVAADGAGGFRRFDFGAVTVPPHRAYRVTVASDLTDAEVGLIDVASGEPAVGVMKRVDPVSRPPFRLIGARQDYGIGRTSDAWPNRYGQGVSYLFNRPPEKASAERAETYRIRSTFDGGEDGTFESFKVGLRAFLQPSGRVVNVRYSSPISALWDAAAGAPLVEHEHRIDPADLVDDRGESLDAAIPEPYGEHPPQHLGGLVGGRVLRGTGTPAPSSKVELIRPRVVDTPRGFEIKLDLVGEVTTGDDGSFFFDFVEQPHPDPWVEDEFVLRATVPAGDDPATEPATVEEVSSTIRLQNRLNRINIALLGRGTVTGELVYLGSGEPVEGGSVTVASTLFDDAATVQVAVDGSFTVPGMPVGPLTLAGRDPEGRTVYATVGIESPGGSVHVLLELLRSQPPGMGTVVGTVLRYGSGLGEPTTEPVAGAEVELTAQGMSLGIVGTDGYGRFRFAKVPAGQVTVQAADWRVSRASVLTDLILAADQVADVTLTLPDEGTRSVEGRVLFHDPVANELVPVAGASVFVPGPGVFSYSESDGSYRIDGLPVQAAGEANYHVRAIDFDRNLEGSVEISTVGTDPETAIAAQDIVLRERSGGIDGVVLDPLGRPLGGAEVIASQKGVPLAAATTLFDGSFSFSDLPLGEWILTAHVGDGLEAGRVGYFGVSAKTTVLFGGHRPFASVRMAGSGVVDLQVSSAQGTVWAQVYYRPTYYSQAAKSITLKGVAVESATDPNGSLRLELPVGSFEITVFSAFHGARTVGGRIAWPGQVETVEVVFDGSSSVSGRLVNVDGVTPIPDFEVELRTETLLPQRQRTDPEGRFRFELVPKGRLEVRAEGLVGAVERVGRAAAFIGSGGQEVELLVRMKAQGTIQGGVFERVGDQTVPVPYAQYYVYEESYPFRRLPPGDGWYSADAEGRYELAHVYAGSVNVTARDPSQVNRRGSSKTVITSDWEVATVSDIVLSTDVGSISVIVRDPETGATLPDTQVRIRAGWDAVNELTVADGNGAAHFDALPLLTYAITAFHAPSGRSGRLDGVKLAAAGQHLERTLFVDQRGSVGGRVFDDAAKQLPVPGATVLLSGQTAGGSLSALDTTSGHSETLGRFEFQGIPEGEFQLAAAKAGSPRRGRAEVALTATAPVAEVDLVLEPVDAVHFRVFERLRSGFREIDPATTSLSVRLLQTGFDFSLLQPSAPAPGHLFSFNDVLVDRSGSLSVQELGGEQRRAGFSASNFASGVPLDGSGSAADPYRVVLGPKGVVRVVVTDADGQPVAGANVTLTSSRGGRFPSLTGADGSVTFAAVPAGTLDVAASAPEMGVGGRSTALLEYDDDVIEVQVSLAAAVSAHGTVYQPVPGDVWDGDPASLVPQAGAIVVFDYSGGRLTMTTGDDGAYRFDALPEGSGFAVTAQSPDGQGLAATSGVLSGPNGHDNEIAPLILDGGPPEIVSIVPPPGMQDVSRTATVEIVFSEPLLTQVVPTGQHTSPYFELSGPGGVALGNWTAALDGQGRQLVRFTPSEPYDNQAVYSLTVTGGPSGVRDRAGRPMTATGDVGSNFKTSDSVGPAVIGSVPVLDRPVAPGEPVRFDFNESLIADDEQLDGDGEGDAGELWWGRDNGSGLEWQLLPATLFMTRANYSLVVDPVEGLELEGDSLMRRVRIAGLADDHANLMEPFEREYRVWDANPPAIDELPPPPTAPDGELVPGVTYVVTPVLSGIDHFPLDPPHGDLDFVAYYFEDPSASVGSPQPGFVATAPPYAFTFVAGYSGNGVDPRPFPVWARAVDTSTNESNLAELQMIVMPNQAPTVGVVTAEALDPVPGVPYAGSRLGVSISGIADPDGTQLALEVHLWQEGGAVLDAAPTVTVLRPATGDWTDLAPPSLEVDIPSDLPEGTELFVRARVTDSSGASATAESARFVVADDQLGPRIDGLTVRSADDGSARSTFSIGQRLYIELEAFDAETGVVGVAVSVDRVDVFPEQLTADRVAGDTFRTQVLTVPVDVFSEATTIEVTASADDRGGNTTVETMTFEVAPEPDPFAPTADWLTPWEGGAWPADYTSQASPGTGAAMLLRVHASDLSESEDGETVPGTIVAVSFRGPVADGAGGLRLADEPTPGSPVAGSEGPGEAEYQAVWNVPDGIPEGTEIPFQVRVVDSGGLDVVRTARLTAVSYRKVYEGVQSSVQTGDGMLAPGGDPNGAVFLLDGSTLSVYPQTDGSVRELASLYLYAGGEPAGGGTSVHPTVLTVPRITSFDSSILYYPLELRIDSDLAVGAAARIDVSGCGLMGNTEHDHAVLPGERAASTRAGGSHGGSGWYGWSSTNWDYATRYEPSSIYGNVRDPHLPGAGGGGASGSFGAVYPGAPGGGVARIDVTGGTVHLEGGLLADGGDSGYGSGAGGSIWLSVDRLEGGGLISSDGGRSSGDRSGGGGGGRISVVYRELADSVDLFAQISAAGGRNVLDHLAGAGTIYLDVLDPETGKPTGVGRLRAGNPVGTTAASTLLPALGDADLAAVDPAARTLTLTAAAGRGDVAGERVVVEDSNGLIVGSFDIIAQQWTDGTAALEVAAAETELGDLQSLLATEQLSAHCRTRFGEVVAAGAVRLAFDNDLEVGPVGDPAPALNDPAAVSLESGARAILRGMVPEIAITAVPEPGTEISVGASVEISWTAGDSTGIWEHDEAWPIANHIESRLYPDQPTMAAADPDPLVLTVPWNAEAGDADLRLRVTDVAGRTSIRELSWTVVDNAQPTGFLAFADGAPTTVLAGTSTSVVVHAEDAEGLAAVRLEATGPAVDPVQTAAVSGTVQDLMFDVRAEPDADGSTPIVLRAIVTDGSGASFTTGLLEVGVVPDLEPPTVTITLVPAAYSDIYESGDEVTIRAIRSDNVGIGFSSLSIGGAVTTSDGPTIVVDWIAPAVAEETAFEISAEVHDLAGNVGTATRTLTVRPHVNANPPAVTFLCPVNGDYCAAGVGTTIDFTLRDDVKIASYTFSVNGEMQGDQTAVNQRQLTSLVRWTPPAGTQPGAVFSLRIEARDYADNVGSSEIDLTAVSGTVLSSAQHIGSDHSGEDLVLVNGVFTASAPLRPASLRLLRGATLSPRYVSGATAHPPITISTSGVVDIACGAAIDVSGDGYLWDTMYPGVDLPVAGSSGGSHLGQGGALVESPGETFGSVYRPRENGGTTNNGQLGSASGGVVRIEASAVALDEGAVILANAAGTYATRPTAAGGSVWISAASVSGSGTIEARGGRWLQQAGVYPNGSGGGGAIAIDFDVLDEDIVSGLTASGGPSGRDGGAGTIYLNGAGSTYGDLVVDNDGRDGAWTVLPTLGTGQAVSGSGGTLLVTDRDEPIPTFFEGHWVRLTGPDPERTPKGTYRIEAVNGYAVTFGAGADVAPGDLWQGVYRFDTVTVTGKAKLRLYDADEFGTVVVEPGSAFAPINEGGPEIDADLVEIEARDGAYWVSGLFEAIQDVSGVAEAELVNVVSGESWEIPQVEDDGSFGPVAVGGAVGDWIAIHAVDAHPEPAESTTQVKQLPANAGAPQIHEPLLGFVVDANRTVHLLGGPGSVDVEGQETPVVLAITNSANGFSTGLAVAADGSFDTVVVADAGDVLTLTAADGHPEQAVSEPLNLTVPVLIVEAAFEAAEISAAETAGTLTLDVVLNAEAAGAATVRYRTVQESASPGYDYVETTGELAFAPGETRHTVEVPILDDERPEGGETFRIELYDVDGVFLGDPASVEVAILSDDLRVEPVTFSVGVASYSSPPMPAQLWRRNVDIVDGLATFNFVLPDDVDRGDQLEIDDYGVVFVGECPSDTQCRVYDGRGFDAGGVMGAKPRSFSRAFPHLADAVVAAADADHLDTFDLASEGVDLDLLCYGSDPDPLPVDIVAWITSPDSSIRIAAPTAAEVRGWGQRHLGHWTDGAYRLEVDGDDCLRSSVGNLRIEGLQLHCSGSPGSPIAGIRLDGADGRVEIAGTLLRLDGASEGDRTGIDVAAAVPGEVVVRNSVIWDFGDGSSDAHDGILVSGPGVTVFAANNTIVGGAHGIRNDGGEVTAVNNLVLGSTIAAFEGAFAVGSTANLSEDGTAPGAPANSAGPVAVAQRLPGPDLDPHLMCGVLDLDLGSEVTISHSFNPGDWPSLFDGVAETLAVSQPPGDATVTLEFAEPRVLTGTGIAFSNSDGYVWRVEAAMNSDDLDQKTGSYVDLVPEEEREVVHRERSRRFVRFTEPQELRLIRLTSNRLWGADPVFVGEWWLEGLNPACGQGADLSSRAGATFTDDVDGNARVGSWDIGADQDNELTVGFVNGAADWWEEEGAARIQVMLSEPAPAPVRVRFVTQEISARPGSDYEHTDSEVVFESGEISKIVTVPLVDDGVNENAEPEYFGLELVDSVGAALGQSWWWVNIHDGDPPVRVRLQSALMEADEREGIFTAGIELEAPQPTTTQGSFDVADHTARFSLDYRGTGDGAPWLPFSIPGGQTAGSVDVEILADGEPEPVEGFLIRPGALDDVQPGVPSVGYVRILDYSPLTVSFASDVVEVGESEGAVSLRVRLSEPASDTVWVQYFSEPGSAAGGGTDYVELAGELEFAPGTVEQTIEIEIVDDAEFEDTEWLRVELSDPIGVELGSPASVEVRIVDDDPPPVEIFLDPEYLEVNETAGAAELRVLLSAPAAHPVTVQLQTESDHATSGLDYISLDTVLEFAPGEVERVITIEILDDAEPELEEFIRIDLSEPSGGILGSPDRAWVLIVDDEPRPIAAFLEPPDYELIEAQEVITFAVALSEEPPGEVRVRFQTVEGSASAGSDFTAADGELVFAPGESYQLFDIEVLDDAAREDTESFYVELYQPVGIILEHQWRAEVTIVDDEPSVVRARFEQETVEIGEGSGALELRIVLSGPAVEGASLRYRSVPGSAEAGPDFAAVDDVLSLSPGEMEAFVTIPIFDDGGSEETESFLVELYDPLELELGFPDAVEVAILDDEHRPPTIVFSVGPDGNNWLPDPIGVDIEGGIATFAQALPPGPVRGDRLEIEGVGAVYLGPCSSDIDCEVFDGRGDAPADLTGGSATSIVRAFPSLQAAIIGASDAGHLGTSDLVAADRSLELRCYGAWGEEADSGPVVIDGWTTSADHLIRVVVPDQPSAWYPWNRHPGRWDEIAYFLDVDDGTCITSSVGNLVLEGLQMRCSGAPEEDVHGVLLDGIDGDVTISESIIRLDGAAASGARVGVELRAVDAAEVVVRNTVLYDLGDGRSPGHAGIVISAPAASLRAANTTVFGGAYGVRSLGGDITVVNTIAAEASLACFDGSFTPESERNLSTDGSAPGPPSSVAGELSMFRPTNGNLADFHLLCGLVDDVASFDADFDIPYHEQLRLIFDGAPETGVVSPSINPARVFLVLAEPRTFTATGVELGECASHTWTVEAADDEHDLLYRTGSYRVLVDEETADGPWDEIVLAAPETVGAIALTVAGDCQGNQLRLNEWSLSGYNPACGQGLNLAADSAHAFGTDIDSAGRAEAWDIGADQSEDATVDFFYGDWSWWGLTEWWESEGAARLQVDLSHPVGSEVRVFWEAYDGSAAFGEDYLEASGELVFPPGAPSQILTIPLVDDGEGEGDEYFDVILTRVSGARLDYIPGVVVTLLEGDPPPRVSLASTRFEAAEADGEATAWANLSQPVPYPVTVWWDVSSRSAKVGSDFQDTTAPVTFAPGETQVPVPIALVDDDEAEGAESFVLRAGSLENGMPGVPARAWIRIADDDGGKRGAAERVRPSTAAGGSPLRISASAGDGRGPGEPASATVVLEALRVQPAGGLLHVLVPASAVAGRVDLGRSSLVNLSTGAGAPMNSPNPEVYVRASVTGDKDDELELNLCFEDRALGCTSVRLGEGR